MNNPWLKRINLKKQIKVGDVVCFLDDPQLMTLEFIDYSANLAICVWYDNIIGPQKCSFTLSDLNRVEMLFP